MSLRPSDIASRWGSRWEQWLFARGDPRALALFRMGWAAAMFADAVHDWGRASLYAPERYHLPLLAGIGVPDAQTYPTLIRVAALGCLLSFAGPAPRFAAVVVCVVNGYLLASDVLLFRNHVYLGCLLGLLLAASPCDRSLCADPLVRRLVGVRPARGGTWAAVAVIRAQVLIVYLWSVANKLRPSFLDGWTLQQELPHALDESPVTGLLHTHVGLHAAVLGAIESHHLMMITAWVVVVVEAGIFVGLTRRRTCRYAAAAGVVLHGAICLTMGVVTFGLLMVSSYPLFLAAARMGGARGRLRDDGQELCEREPRPQALGRGRAP